MSVIKYAVECAGTAASVHLNKDIFFWLISMCGWECGSVVGGWGLRVVGGWGGRVAGEGGLTAQCLQTSWSITL